MRSPFSLGWLFPMQSNYLKKAGQTECLCTCLKFVNKAFKGKFILNDMIATTSKKSHSWNDEMVEYLLNILNSHKANVA